MKLNKTHTWKHIFVVLFVFLLGFFACKLFVYKKAFTGKTGKKGIYFHLKAGDKEVYSSQLKQKTDYEDRLKTVEEKVKLLEEQLVE